MTLMGLGAFPGEHPLSMGMMGMHGTYQANMAIHYADLVVAIGARFDDRVTGKVSEFCPYAKIIHIDIDPTSIRKNIHVDIPIVGDCKAVLRELNPDPEGDRQWRAKGTAQGLVGANPGMGAGPSLDLSTGKRWTDQAAAGHQAVI